ncbi:MAG: aminodeoxychorismate/anthranilate synthase component II, partial [Flavipsychrobacter sp.]|nr:aminodeoxychorismate/anthranilate synthase component II [Flavipsychrobacter sp.]
MWVLIDNYDSFTYILHHYLLQTGHECTVYKNDALSVQQLAALRPSRLILSPGPETPLQAGICMEAIAHFYDKIPILGICLGHQAIGMHFGAELVHAAYPMHGKISQVRHDGSNLFRQIPQVFPAMRYHSLVLENMGSTGLVASSHAQDDDALMSFHHASYPCTGIQFHPESVGTEHGVQLLKNWA